MLLKINRPRRALMNVVIGRVGETVDGLYRIVTIKRPGRTYFDEPAFLNDEAGLTGGDGPAQSRTITWPGDQDVTLRWQLPSPGR